MRRAEKAGREDAAAWLLLEQRDARAISARHNTPLLAHITLAAMDRADFDRHLAIANLRGHSQREALRAYDKGYRERLKEALAESRKPPLYNQDKLGE